MIARLRRRWGRLAGWAVVALIVPTAIVLGVVGVDLLRSPGELASDDKRFQTSPTRQAGLWDVGLLPRDVNERLLGLEDDIAYRRIAGEYLRVEPGKVYADSSPKLESLQAKVQFEVTRMSREDTHLERRSHLLTLYGVIRLASGFVSSEERDVMLREAASAFRNAITLDPENADAKTNLEAVLSVFGPVVLASNAPSQGTAQGRVSGQGRPGSGY